VFLFLSGRRDGAFRVIPVTSDSGLLVSRPLRLALSVAKRGGHHVHRAHIFVQIDHIVAFDPLVRLKYLGVDSMKKHKKGAPRR